MYTALLYTRDGLSLMRIASLKDIGGPWPCGVFFFLRAGMYIIYVWVRLYFHFNFIFILEMNVSFEREEYRNNQIIIVS